MDIRKVDARLLEDTALSEHARPAAPAAFALPAILAEVLAVELFQGGDNALLKVEEMGGSAMAEREGRHGRMRRWGQGEADVGIIEERSD
jgi:hypothetical protein